MNHNNRTIVRSFFSPRKSVYALCAFAVALALGQTHDAFASSKTGAKGAGEREVSVTTYGTVDLAVQDTDLGQVLQMLSIQSKKNIVASPSISATVTANLYDVTFHEALDSILRVNGFGYIEEGNFVYIYTLAELEEIERANRRTESRIFELEHLSALDAREFVEPLLSEDGKISARGEVTAGFRPDISDGGADDYAFTAKIVVNDYPDNLDAIANLLRQLDTPPQQVLVEATVLRTTLNEDNSFGVDFSVIGSMNFTDVFNPLSPISDLLAGGNVPGEQATEDAGFVPADNRAHGVQSPMGQTHRPGGLKVGIIHDNVSAFLRVLDEVSDSTILARPKILALNRQRAQVLVGEKVAYRSTTATQTATTQNVEFLNTGIELAFRPFISRDGMIRMELQPKVSFAALRELGDGEQVPDEFTNELTTNVRVREGETLVLGGLFQEEIVNRRRQVPIFGDIPIVGAAFRGHDDEVRRSEIIFLITPTIVHDEVLWDMGRDALAYTQAAQVGARAGLLPFSRTRITNHYNQLAVEAYNEGDYRRAEHFANISLRLHPNQSEMIRLRQRMTGTQDIPFERSILERVFRRELGPLHEEQKVDEYTMADDESDHPGDDEWTASMSEAAKPEDDEGETSKSQKVKKSTDDEATSPQVHKSTGTSPQVHKSTSPQESIQPSAPSTQHSAAGATPSVAAERAGNPETEPNDNEKPRAVAASRMEQSFLWPISPSFPFPWMPTPGAEATVVEADQEQPQSAPEQIAGVDPSAEK